MITSGVFPVYENQFKINTGTSQNKTWSAIADLESFSISIDNGIEEWRPFSEGGWRRALLTAKAVTFSVSGKRNIGDAGNDKIAGMAFLNGRNAEADIQWTFPDGTVVEFDNAVISVTELNAGDSTNVGPLSFDITSNGQPTVTPAG